MGPDSPLQDLYNWLLNAETQLAIIIFLSVGLVSTVWTLVIKPLLNEFSHRYRIHKAEMALRDVKPILNELGLLEDAKHFRGVQRLKYTQNERPEVYLKSRLIEIMKKHYINQKVMLGVQHSQPNPYYIDLQNAVMTPATREVLANILANLIATEIRANVGKPEFRNFDGVVGMKEGNPLMAALVAQKLRLPLTIFRGVGRPKFHGSTEPEDSFDGDIFAGENLILVDDCTFRGTTLIESIRLLLLMNANVCGVFLLFEPKLNVARSSIEGLGIPLYSVVTIDHNIQRKLSK